MCLGEISFSSVVFSFYIYFPFPTVGECPLSLVWSLRVLFEASLDLASRARGEVELLPILRP